MLALDKYSKQALIGLARSLDDACVERHTFQNFRELLTEDSQKSNMRYKVLLTDIHKFKSSLEKLRMPEFSDTEMAILFDLLIVYMLELDINEVPMYLNSGSELVRAVCRWRLEQVV